MKSVTKIDAFSVQEPKDPEIRCECTAPTIHHGKMCGDRVVGVVERVGVDIAVCEKCILPGDVLKFSL